MGRRGRLDWRKVEHEVAEALRDGGYEVAEREPTDRGGDLIVEALLRSIVEVKSVNVQRVADSGDARIFYGPKATLRKHWSLAEDIGADDVVVVGIAHDGHRILAAGALDGIEFEQAVESARRAAAPTKLLRPLRISGMDDVRNFFPGVALPRPNIRRAA